MATVYKRKSGTFEIQYQDANGKRRSIYLPRSEKNKRVAEGIAAKVDHLASRIVLGAEPDRDVAEWVASLPDTFHSKLVKHGLTAPRTPAEPADDDAHATSAPTIKDWTDNYVKNHSAKDGTIEQLEITARSICRRFGDDKRIDTFTAGDAEDFRKWLETKGNERKKYKVGLAKNTVRRRIGRTKQFFGAAVKHELISRNPFEGEASAVGGNDERLFMVPAKWIEKCIQNAPCEDWRIILALARYGGLRSHEARIQRWADIDIENERMTIRSNKTPPMRSCPIFPELMPHLLRARQHADPDAEFVQTRYDHEANILTTFAKIVAKSGLEVWPKLMQNLRATRETELLAKYPAKDVTSWLGNSPDVANRHYAMAMQESFERAKVERTTNLPVAKKVRQEIRQTTPAKACQPLPHGEGYGGIFGKTLLALFDSYPART
ncbi:phage integrase SAM-like domain-containing protein [Stieleria magnilauensis]|uniref:tyrosine-type recombinase/integrase n=1 Tax=Stieleria magnilauensis TaxID=2527963 RepID=UPI00119CAFDB